MSRVKIELPACWSFSAAFPVRITDLNYGRHVGNDTMLAYLQEARVQWLRSLGYPSELLAEPVGLILVDLAVRFKAELGAGDTVRVELAVAEWDKLGFELVYRVSKADGAEAARATTRFVFFDYATRRLAPAPDGFREKTAIRNP
jgi:acyl-CoA thioester hydrolase